MGAFCNSFQKFVILSGANIHYKFKTRRNVKNAEIHADLKNAIKIAGNSSGKVTSQKAFNLFGDFEISNTALLDTPIEYLKNFRPYYHCLETLKLTAPKNDTRL